MKRRETMNAVVLSLAVWLLVGCRIDFGHDPSPKPDHPPDVTVKPVEFDAAACSEALARLAERCGTSATRRATMELDGTLNEMLADGVSREYCDRVRTAVPSIGSKPARDLNEAELKALRGVK